MFCINLPFAFFKEQGTNSLESASSDQSSLEYQAHLNSFTYDAHSEAKLTSVMWLGQARVGMWIVNLYFDV